MIWNDFKVMDRVDDVADYWGDLVPIMVSEETGELAMAISKYERFFKKIKDNNVVWDDNKPGWSVDGYGDEEDKCMVAIEEEIGDVLIILHALIKHYGLDPIAIQQRIDSKLNKKY